MRNFLLVLLLYPLGCRTPYQPMGFTGGVQAHPVGPGAYVVTARVNGYTSHGTAYEYAYRRAGEVCPSGFKIADSANSSTSSYLRTTYGVQQVNKPEVTLVVQCNAMTPSPVPSAAATEANWWCTALVGGDNGYCERRRAKCEDRRSESHTSGIEMTACVPQRFASCYFMRMLPQDIVLESCHATAQDCDLQRGLTQARESDVAIAGVCRVVE